MKKLFCLFSALVFSAYLSAVEPIGTVTGLEGRVKAIDPEKNIRILTENGGVYLKDILITAEDAKAEIQFTDGTTLLLIPNTRYKVNAYTFSDIQTNRYIAALSRGGAQLITGLIAQKDPENFQLRTANATIGVRGTSFQARVMDSDLYVGAYSGDISVKNNASKLDLGVNQSHQFASVQSSEIAPKALEMRPAALDPALFTPPNTVPMSTATTGAAASSATSQGISWAPAVAGIAAVGAVVGVVAATIAGTSNSTSSHNSAATTH